MAKLQQPVPSHKQQTFYLEKHTLSPLLMVYKATHSPNYYVRFTVADGYITKSLRTPNLDTAKAKATQMEIDEIQRQRKLSQKKQTVANIAEWYFQQEKFTGVGITRKKQIIRSLRIYSKYFGDKDLHTIKFANWKGYWDFRQNYYKRTDFKDRTRAGSNQYSYKTLLGERLTFLQVMNHAYNHGLMRVRLDAPYPTKRHFDTQSASVRPKPTFTHAEYSKFRKELNKWVSEAQENWRSGERGNYAANAVRAILWTMRHTGARCEEICRIKNKDLEPRKIKLPDGTVAHTFAIFLQATKSLQSDARYAIINYSGYEHLKNFIEYRNTLNIRNGEDDWAFPIYRNQYNRYSQNHIGEHFRRIAKRAGVFEIGDRTNEYTATTRVLRRYYIIRQLDGGTPIEKVAMQVGHSPSTTNRYYNSVMKERYEQAVYTASYYPHALDDD